MMMVTTLLISRRYRLRLLDAVLFAHFCGVFDEVASSIMGGSCCVLGQVALIQILDDLLLVLRLL